MIFLTFYLLQLYHVEGNFVKKLNFFLKIPSKNSKIPEKSSKNHKFHAKIDVNLKKKLKSKFLSPIKRVTGGENHSSGESRLQS